LGAIFFALNPIIKESSRRITGQTFSVNYPIKASYRWKRQNFLEQTQAGKPVKQLLTLNRSLIQINSSVLWQLLFENYCLNPFFP